MGSGSFMGTHRRYLLWEAFTITAHCLHPCATKDSPSARLSQTPWEVKRKKLFIVFAYLTLILVVAAFGSIVANTFKAAYTESGAVDVAASSANATTAMISILFIVLAVVFGFMVYRRNVSLGVSTIAGVAAIVVCVVVD